MAKLNCRDYGYDCDFVVEGEIEHVIEKFGQHMDQVHGIDYTKEALMQIILRKSTWIQNLWAWYFLSSISFSGIIMKLTKTSMGI